MKMERLTWKEIAAAVLAAAVLALCLAGCGIINTQKTVTVPAESPSATVQNDTSETQEAPISGSSSAAQIITESDSDLFTTRDLTQTADLTEAEIINVADGQTYTIRNDGTFVLTGTASDAEIIVDAADEDKVQLVLDGLHVTNGSTPVIYVKNADKVFVTSTETENVLSVTGTFTSDGTTHTDAVIFSKDDLVLNGTGTVTVTSTSNGISTKDDLKVTGGVWNITCTDDALEANESISVGGGTLNIVSSKDGLHAEYDEDSTVGSVTVEGGTINITAKDDGIHATTVATVNGGELTIDAAEGIEATQVYINGGMINITAKDDGINAGQKSRAISVGIEINGGEIYISMGAGDTDAIDSNGYLTITGGSLDIYAQSPFDADGTITRTGGTIYVNGSETDTITNQMMGGGFGPGSGGFGPGGGRP